MIDSKNKSIFTKSINNQIKLLKHLKRCIKEKAILEFIYTYKEGVYNSDMTKTYTKEKYNNEKFKTYYIDSYHISDNYFTVNCQCRLFNLQEKKYDTTPFNYERVRIAFRTNDVKYKDNEFILKGEFNNKNDNRFVEYELTVIEN